MEGKERGRGRIGTLIYYRSEPAGLGISKLDTETLAGDGLILVGGAEGVVG